jgi:uncharacterized protein
MTGFAEEAITFACGDDQLLGILHHAIGTPRRLGIVIVVGGPQYRVGSHRQFVLMSRAFAAEGYPVLRFDYRGMGDSGGAVRSFDEVDDDIRAAIDELTARLPQLEGVALFGLCDGASAACIYAGSDHRVKALVLANPWIRTVEGEARVRVRHHYVQRLLQKSFWVKLASGRLQVFHSVADFARNVVRARAPGAEPAMKNGFQVRMCRGLETFGEPVLLLLSGRDLTASEFDESWTGSARWAAIAGRTGVRTERLIDADHTFSSSHGLDRATGMCMTWLDQFAE